MVKDASFGLDVLVCVVVLLVGGLSEAIHFVSFFGRFWTTLELRLCLSPLVTWRDYTVPPR
jgi:hypothetical protein